MRKIAAFFVIFAFLASPAAAASLADEVNGISVPASMNDATFEQWQKKERHYADALNRVNSIKSTMRNYLGWAKDGPKADAKSVRGISDMSSGLERIQKAAAENAKVGVTIPAMDTAFEEMAKAAKALQTVSSEANKYYSRKDYLADNMARGIELHPELVKAYEAFVAAADPLDAMKEELSDKLEPLKLAHIEKKYGKEYYWQHVNIMGKARAVIKFVPDDVSAKVDGEAYDAAVNALSETLKEFEAYYEQAGDEKIGKLARMPVKPDAFNSFLAAARELGLDFKNPKKSNNSYVNHINSMIRAYNSLIDRSNRTQFLVRK
ncbi:YiiG family protein [Desulfovibrio sp. OttesenSCG-928-O18]|nr:YiiG family protein [Desulfovibrio sp. OttesenSCG-928-O18]